MKLASLVSLKPLKEYESDYLFDLEARLAQLYREMEDDPDVEPEGGPMADQYADEIHKLERKIATLKPKRTPMTYDQAIGRVPKDQFNKSSKFDRMNESTEPKWNAIDVSRKAEKEIDNKEWNSRTTKKLDMLKALNKAGKFKKDWGEDKLQGWVDQNYSWEKLARQFKLNEIYSSMYNEGRKPNLKSISNVDNSDWSVDGGGGNIGYMEWGDGTEMTPQEIQDYFETNHEMYDDIMQGLGETMQQGDHSSIEQGWDGLSFDEQRDIINTALSGEARPDEFEKDFDQLKSEIPDFESGVANYLGIDEGEDLDDYRLEPEDIEDPDEDLVIIGSGYLDIKNKFKGRPNMTNGELATLGQKVVDQLHKGDQDAAFDYIMSRINEVDEGLGTPALQVTDQNGVVAVIEDPKDIEAYDRGNTVIGVTADGKKIELNIDWSEESHMTANEGSCGYSQEAPGGKDLKTPGGTKGMDADKRTMTMMREVIKKEIKKLHENK